MARRRAQSLEHTSSDGQTIQQGRGKKRASDNEDANTESQQMLALQPLLKKPRGNDKEIQQFRAKVASDQRELKALLQQQLHQAEQRDSRRRNEIASKISGALHSSNKPLGGDAPKFRGTKISENPLSLSIGSLLKASELMVMEYESLEVTMFSNAQEGMVPIAEKWKQNVKETERLLRLGHKAAMRNVKKVLGANTAEEELDASEGDGNEMPETSLNYDLQKGLQYAERGVKRMVKSLPIEESRH